MHTVSFKGAGTAHVSMARLIFAGLCAGLVTIGLARFAYTPLLPSLIHAHWFGPADTVYLGAANLAGYLIGAIVARTLGRKFGNVPVIRTSMLVVTLSFIACAFPVSMSWYFVWRLLSGVAGGVVMVLIASTLLPHVPAAKRHMASGMIFLGLGMGIAATGTVIPLLLQWGLPQTWIGLGVLSAVLTGLSWRGWPQDGIVDTPKAAAAAVTTTTTTTTTEVAAAPAMGILYVQYALLALGIVPPMVFLVDYIARGLGAGAHVGAVFWVVYGIGAIIGPPLYGIVIGRIGARRTLQWTLLIQAMAVFGLCLTHQPVLMGCLILVIGTFPPGVPPLLLAVVHHDVPDQPERQQAIWGKLTVLFAAAQAGAGYAYSLIFNASGQHHQVLFVIAGVTLLLCVALDGVKPLLHKFASEKPARTLE